MNQKRNLGFMSKCIMGIIVFLTMLSTTTVTAQNPNNLAGFWRFNEGSGPTLADSSGNSNNGVLTNMAASPWSITDCMYRSALMFGGSGYVSIPNSSSLQITGNLTLSLWLKPTNTTSRYNLIDKSYNREFSLVLENGGGLTFYHGNQSGYFTGTMLPSASIISGQWQHIAITRDATGRTLKAYLNGKLKTTTPITYNSSYDPVSSTSIVKIGNGYLNSGSNGFNGAIDTVLICNATLSDSQIYALACEPRYVAHWRFDENSGINTADSGPYGNNATLSGIPTPTWVSGLDNKALNFNSGAGYVSSALTSNSPQLTQDISISLWIKPTAITSRYNLIDKSYGGEFSLVLEPVGAITFYQGKAKSAGNYFWGAVIASSNIVCGQWQHIAVTRDAATRELKGYLNGKLKTTITYDNNSAYLPFTATTDPVKIGNGYLNNGLNGFNGIIDEVIIADYAFADSEVQSLYDYGNLRGYWTMSEGRGANLYDSSCHGNLASIADSSSSWGNKHINEDGYFRDALSLSGNGNDAVSIPNSPSLQITGDLTLSLWIKPDSVSSRCNLIDKSYGGEFSLVLENAGGVSLFQGNAEATNKYFGAVMLPSSSIVSGKWQHIAVTRNAATGELKGYLNGEPKTTIAYDVNSSAYLPFTATTNTVKIGNGYLSGKFDGCIDQVSIFSKALSPDDIHALYYNLLSVYPERNYYTGESTATIVCNIAMTSSQLQNQSPSCMLVAKNAQGTILASNYTPASIPSLTFNNSSPLINGINPVTVELRRGSPAGDLVFTTTTNLTKRASASTEIKINQKDGYVLQNGNPFFPVGCYSAESSAIPDDIVSSTYANWGFNTVIHWALVCDPGTTIPSASVQYFFSNAAANGLNVIDFMDGYSTIWLQQLFTYKGEMGYWYSGRDYTDITTSPYTPYTSWEGDFWAAYNGDSCPSGKKDYYNNPRWPSGSALSPFTSQYDRILRAVSNTKNYSNLLGYYGLDEPVQDQIAAGQDLYARVTSADGYHPIFVIHPDTIPDDCNFTNWSDIIGLDSYWNPPRINGDFSSSVDKIIKNAYLARRRTKKEHKPFWMALMAQDCSLSNKRAITAAEQRNQTYLALISGARGIFYNHWPIAHDSVLTEISVLNSEISSLNDYLLAPEQTPEITYYDNNNNVIILNPELNQFVDLMVSLHKKSTGDYVLLAANTKEYPVDVTFAISLLGSSGTVGRLFSSNTYSVSNGSFSDQIEGLGTRAYTFSSTSTASPAISVNLTAGTSSPEPVVPRSGRPGKTNLMQNPSLEDSTLSNWPDYCWPLYIVPPRINATESAWTTTPGAEQHWGLINTGAYEGLKCLKIVNDYVSVNGGTNRLSQNGVEFKISPTTGGTYTFSAYIKADSGGLNARIGSSATTSTTTFATIYPTTSWQRYIFTCTLPDRSNSLYSNYDKFYIYLFSQGTIYVDAVQLEAGTVATPFAAD